ncbi:MAG TPA: biotin--[acetyl-CoA-carboxylase] ligase [Candidatus Binatia bacterium]|jgi:BirA family biotin operon repressor/biotin-[acetyl-CoA-carboxylase] ligase|nr:biotin--[acetyl-CoA-carboxylase] ligase [Candidatus Binatia bacterium]
MSDLPDQDFAATLTRQLQTRFLGTPLHFFETIDSTNTYAARLAREGAAEGTIVIADSQSGGKGRLGRSWVSPPGVNLYLSAILRPPVPAATVPQLNLLAAVAVADTIVQVCGLTPAIKWPNDVLVGGKKVCGILAEMQTEAGALRAVVLGIGVNLNAPLSAFPEELRDKASSLFLAGSRLIDRPAFAAALLTHLEKLYVLWLEEGFPALRPAWEHHAVWMIGSPITVAAPEGTVAGTVLGLDSDGALLLQEGNSGTPRRLLAGDVTVVSGYTHGVRS